MGAQRLLGEKCSEPEAVAQRSEGVEAAATGDECSPVARTAVKKRLCSSTVRSEAELGSGDARRVAGTAVRRNASRLIDASGLTTS